MEARESAAAARRRCALAERERDIAIEEAAVAWHELGQLRREVEALHREKKVWEATQDERAAPYDQVLWHVAAMAETLWVAFTAGQQADGGGMSVEDAKLLALETLETLVSKSDAQQYEEMHELYAKIAHMEAQQSQITDKMRELKKINDQLMVKTQRVNEERASAAREEQQPRKSEVARASASPANPSDVDSSSGLPAAVRPLLANRSASIIETDTKQPRAADDGEPSTVALLQAQLAMYVRYTGRYSSRHTTSSASTSKRIEQ